MVCHASCIGFFSLITATMVLNGCNRSNSPFARKLDTKGKPKVSELEDLAWICLKQGDDLALEPQLGATPRRIDLGVVRPNIAKQISLSVTNAHAKTINLLHAAASCSCTAVQLSPATLAPNEIAKLTIGYHSNSSAADIREQVALKFDDSDHSTLRIEITGVVRDALTCFPPNLDFFYTRPRKQPIKSASVRVENYLGWPLEKFDCRSQCQWLRVSATQASIPAGKSARDPIQVWQLEVTPVVDLVEFGQSRGSIHLIGEDAFGDRIEKTLWVSMDLQRSIRLVPDSIFVGRLGQTDVFTRSVFLRSDEPLSTADDDFVRVVLSEPLKSCVSVEKVSSGTKSIEYRFRMNRAKFLEKPGRYTITFQPIDTTLPATSLHVNIFSSEGS